MRIRAKDVALFVAAKHGLTFADFTSDCRRRPVARPRQIAMHTIKALCPHMSYPAVGTLLGGRDHTTIMHGDRKIAELKAMDPDIAEAVDGVLGHFRALEAEQSSLALDIKIISLCPSYSEAMRQAA